MLFGEVASQPTAWRAVKALADSGQGVTKLAEAVDRTRQRAWDLGAAPALLPEVPVIVDIDATIVTVHSDKQGATGTYKRTFGFAPLLAWLDRGDGDRRDLGRGAAPGQRQRQPRR